MIMTGTKPCLQISFKLQPTQFRDKIVFIHVTKASISYTFYLIVHLH